jgi:hypothetical protein
VNGVADHCVLADKGGKPGIELALQTEVVRSVTELQGWSYHARMLHVWVLERHNKYADS